MCCVCVMYQVVQYNSCNSLVVENENVNEEKAKKKTSKWSKLIELCVCVCGTLLLVSLFDRAKMKRKKDWRHLETYFVWVASVRRNYLWCTTNERGKMEKVVLLLLLLKTFLSSLSFYSSSSSSSSSPFFLNQAKTTKHNLNFFSIISNSKNKKRCPVLCFQLLTRDFFRFLISVAFIIIHWTVNFPNTHSLTFQGSILRFDNEQQRAWKRRKEQQQQQQRSSKWEQNSENCVPRSIWWCLFSGDHHHHCLNYHTQTFNYDATSRSK